MRLKTTSKETQKAFIERIRKLVQDPAILLPECLDGGFFCPISSYRKKLSSSGSLERFAGSSDQLLSGIGETAKLASSDEIPLFAVLKTPLGSMEYAKRGGSTDDLVLAGVQHFDDPVWRMLAFSSLAKTKGLRVYSTSGSFISSCRNTSPGIGVFKEILLDEDIEFNDAGGVLNIGNAGTYLEILHLGKTIIRSYENSSQNTAAAIMKHVLTPEFQKDFVFRIGFLENLTSDIPQQLVSDYLSGKNNDRTFIRSVKDHRTRLAVSKGSYVVGSDGFKGVDDFLKNFTFTVMDEATLREFLPRLGVGIAMDAFSERKVLEVLWPKFGGEILSRLYPELTDEDRKLLRGSPMEQIDTAASLIRMRSMRREMGVDPWSEDSAFLLEMVGKYFSHGSERLIKDGEREMGQSSQRRSIYLAIITAVGDAGAKDWMFTQSEKELAWKLLPYVRKIIQDGPSKLRENIAPLRGIIR